MRGALFILEVTVFLSAPFFMMDLGMHEHALHLSLLLSFMVAMESSELEDGS